MQGKGFLYYLSQPCFAEAAAASRRHTGQRAGRQQCLLLSKGGNSAGFPNALLGQGEAEHSWVCGPLGGIQLLAGGSRPDASTGESC